MNSKNKKTLKVIFSNPVSASLKWKDVEILLLHLGADIQEGSGSRVRLELNSIEMVFHRPHPRKEIWVRSDQYVIFLEWQEFMIMRYKGYIGNVSYDEEARIFHGEIKNQKSIITFRGRTVEELEDALRESVDDYLLWCKERNKKPDRPYSGKINVRLGSALHARLARQASQNNQSLNSLILEKLKK